MRAKNSIDPPLLAGLIFTALNLLNLVAWAFGHHVSIGFYLLTFGLTLIYGIWTRRAKLLIVCLVLVIFMLITLNDPLTGWDARSIWFFHGKRIFLHHSLYAPLDGYAPWTHNDYPILVPALAASVAATVGYWNEVVPRSAEVLALAPALFFGAHAFRSVGNFCVWLSLLVYVCWGEILGGYMDSLIAIHFSLAVLALAEIYRVKNQHPDADQPDTTPRWGLVLSISLLNLLLLKNEGLALSAIVVVCALPLLLKDFKLLALSALPFVVFAGIWKIPVLHAKVSTDLIEQGGQLQRGLQRLNSAGDLGLIFDSFNQFSHWFAIALVCLTAYAILKRRQLAYLLPSIAAILAYAVVLIAVYLTTFHELAWHLSTSADRVLLTVNLAIGTLVLYALAEILNQARHSPYWGKPTPA
jgi:hypothetical protein